jgi:phosphatidylinositol 4-kinase
MPGVVVRRSVAGAPGVAPSADAAAGAGGSGDSADSDATAVVVGPAGAGSGAGAAGVGAGAGKAPPSVVFAERWREKEARIAALSPFAHLPGWRLMPVIVKAHDDLRQEQFASQLLQQFAHIFRNANVPVWMRPYDILATSADGGLIQAIPDTISVDALKRGDPHFTTLDDWFERHYNFGARGQERVAAARLNFARSMAAYSIVCYILAIKDRHNGNILIDRKGHIMHIDFGFL